MDIEIRKKSIRNVTKKYNRVDRSFILEKLFNICKYSVRIDKILDNILKNSNRSVRKLDCVTRNALRISSYFQIIENFFPAVFRIIRNEKKRKFIFAIEKLIEKFSEKEISFEDDIEFMSFKFSYPKFLIKRLINFLNRDFLEEYLVSTLRNYSQYIFLFDEKYRDKLMDFGYYLKETDVPGLYKIIGEKMEGDFFLIREGKAILVDYSTCKSIYNLAKIIEEKFNKKEISILDCFSSPGIKVILLSNFLDLKLNLTLIEKNKRRYNILIKNLEKFKVKNFKSINKDFREVGGKYDVVIFDVPCSSTGIIHKYPELKITLNENILNRILSYQKELIDHLLKNVKFNVLYYATCSSLYEENEKNFKFFLESLKDFEFFEDKNCFNIVKGVNRFWTHLHDCNTFSYSIFL